MNVRFSNLGLLVAVTLSLLGCHGKSKSDGKEGEAEQAAKAMVSKDVGTIEGIVVMEGDPSLVMDADSQKIPLDCDAARQVYPPLFREGPGRSVADVFVSVTGYHGGVADKTQPVQITAKGCAFSTRTIGLTKAQHITVVSGDERTYVPSLFGSRVKATLVAVPHGSSVPVYHRGPGQYVLVDDMRIFAQATVLVVDYPTFDVTNLDGKFRIEGVPAGSVDVSAMLPSAGLSVSQKVTVERNRVVRVPLKLRFDAEKFKAARAQRSVGAQAAPAAAPSP